mmetsp:Transcript_76146/g.176626  ORF Transcript_76146/g.176626 Transcript_76146/m.176626 type:complete len:267 (+) Transcript_76146:243-1043(+)
MQVEIQILPNHLRCYHRKGHDEDGDLRAGADGDGNRRGDLVRPGHAYGRRVLARIAHNGQQNDAHEGLWHVPFLHETINGVDHVLREEGNNHRAGKEQAHGPRHAQDGHLLVLLAAAPREERRRSLHHVVLPRRHCCFARGRPVASPRAVNLDRAADSIQRGEVDDLQMAVLEEVQFALIVGLDGNLHPVGANELHLVRLLILEELSVSVELEDQISDVANRHKEGADPRNHERVTWPRSEGEDRGQRERHDPHKQHGDVDHSRPT